jgi:flagellar hook protein FlgE
VSSSGDAVQGWTTLDPVTGDIISSGIPTDIIIPPGALRAPTPTSVFQTVSNLDANAVVGGTFSTAIQIVDSLGAGHLSTITYTNTAPGTWTYDVTVPGADVTGGVVGTPFNIATGTLVFDALGVLATVNGAAPADIAIVTPTWTNGAAASNISWDIVNGVPYLTGFAAQSATASITQNGTAAGQLQSFSLDGDGNIVATFGSGQSVKLAQLAMAVFNNPKGLTKLGENRFGESQSAGLPNIGTAGSGGRGSLIGSALEQSNVDIALEFTRMILAQRGFQANSRTITVSDELMLETLNLKR